MTSAPTLAMIELTPENFTDAFKDSVDRLSVIYFWGENCPNCVYGHSQLDLHSESLQKFPVNYYTVNAYIHTELATRYALIGIPSFLFVRNEKVLGRVTGFPGIESFRNALEVHSATNL
ncbi:MAG: thioredoxin family protein [Methylotenera sp.]|nr:thioredoxin family protein [Oligoflexia bacterium]